MSEFPWEPVLDQLELELAATHDADRRAAICCRLALLHWDFRGDRTTAQHWLSRIENPYAPALELRRQVLLDCGDAAGAAALLEEQATRLGVTSPGGQLLLLQAALLVLIGTGDAKHASALCQQLEREGLEHPWLSHLSELALATAEELGGVVERAFAADSSPWARLYAAAVLHDRQGQADRALQLLEQSLAQGDDELLVIELLLELDLSLRRSGQRAALLEKKLAMLSSHGPEQGDVLALAFELARIFDEQGQVEQAGVLLERLAPRVVEPDDTDPLAAGLLDWSMATLRIARRDHALRAGDREQLAQAYLSLAEHCSLQLMGRVYRLRAAQLAELVQARPDHAEQLLRRNLQLGPTDQYSTMALESLLLRRRALRELAELYQSCIEAAASGRKGLLLRKAAIAVDLLGNEPAWAASLIRDALAQQSDALSYGDLLRLCRPLQSLPRLMETYQKAADACREPATASLWLSMAAALRLEAGEADGAMTMAHQALHLMPDDPLALAILVSASEAAGRQPELVQALKRQSEVLAAPANRGASLLRLAAETADGHAAMAAYERALTFDSECIPALVGFATASRRLLEPAALLDALRKRLAQVTGDESRAVLLLELGRTLEAGEGAAEEIIDAYAAAAGAAAQRNEALGELERVCRQHGQLDRLVHVLSKLPPQAETLERLTRLLEETDELAQLHDVLQRRIELAQNDEERADCTCKLASVLERLGRADEAVGQFERVLSLAPRHHSTMEELHKLYRRESKLPALVALIEEELAVEAAAERQVELLIELAHAQESIGRKAMAALRLEEALALQPGNIEVMWDLERLYDPNQPLELARVLALHARVEPSPVERSMLLLRAGEIYAVHHRPEEALLLLREAVLSDMNNRIAFSSYEGLCYAREHWRDLVEFYEQLIELVERAEAKPFRLVDLYVRRGQVLLAQLKQPREAAASLILALEHDPKSESVMKMLEGLFVQQQDWHGLIQTYAHRATLVPNNELFRLESLRQAARLATGRLPPGEPQRYELWEEVHALDPADEEAMDNLERLYEEAALYERVAGLLEARLATAVTDEAAVELNLRLARLYEQELENPRRAATAYEGVRRIDEHHEISLKALARIYEATGMWTECVEVLKDLMIMEADPNERSLLCFKCGSIMEARFHQDEQAISYYEAALKEAPACLPALHGLRDIHLRREDWNNALETLEVEVRLWDEGREQAGVLARMGEIRLQHLGDVAGAVDLFEDALAIDANCQPAAAALFDLYFARADYSKAMEVSEKLLPEMSKEGDPQQRSEFFARRGQLLAQQSMIARAADSLVMALQLKPDDLQALSWLIQLCRESPEAYDFAMVFRELEQVYRREQNQAAVGRVLVAAGTLSELAGDAETALARYQAAVESAPEDVAPAKVLADLLLRLRRPEEAVAVLERLAQRASDRETQAGAMLRIGEIWSDVCMDPLRATEVYRELVSLGAGGDIATFSLAQQEFLAGRYLQAENRMRELVGRLAQQGAPSPHAFARYVHFLGVVLLQRGDDAGAREQFRLALRLDDGNADAAMALAQQLEQSGDSEGARELLAAARDDGPVALELRRALAGSHARGGDLDEAIAQLAAVVQAGGRLEDRIVLAELYARQPNGISRAITELLLLVEGDRFNPHVLRLLAELYARSSNPERNLQVLQVMEMLGWANQGERAQLGELLRQYGSRPAQALDSTLRQSLRAPLHDSFLQQAWESVREPLQQLFPLEVPESKMVPVTSLQQTELRRLAEGCRELLGVEAAVWIADGVPSGVAADSEEGAQIIVDRRLVEQPPTELAFLLGRSLGYLQSEHALLSRLPFDDRLLLGELLAGLLQAPEAQNDLVQEFRRGLPRRAIKQVDEVGLAYRAHLTAGGEANQPGRWISSVDRTANHAGLVACDDIGAALRMLAQLSGQELAVGSHGEVAVQLLVDGPELVQFFLAEAYLKLRRRVVRADEGLRR